MSWWTAPGRDTWWRPTGCTPRCGGCWGWSARPAAFRRYGLRRHFAIAPWTSHVEVHWASSTEAYVTPVARDLVGVAMLTSTRGSFDDHLALFPALRSRLATSEAGDVHGRRPVAATGRSRVAGRVLLVGDAAGYVDALTGEGVALAVAQARSAVRAIDDDDPERYDREWHPITRRYRVLTAGLPGCDPGASCTPGARPGRRPAAARVLRCRHVPGQAGMNPAPPELVVLVDEDGHAIGTAAKATVHHRETPLHLAFSCYIFDGAGRMLLTCRALEKPTWPGVWTNSFCGHPSPGEDIFDAVRRRAREELGITLDRLQLTLPTFRYEATMTNGIRENELCPVFTATTLDDVQPNPSEVSAHEWVDWAAFRDTVLAGDRDISPWAARQVADLAERATADGFLTAPTSELPPAAS